MQLDWFYLKFYAQKNIKRLFMKNPYMNSKELQKLLVSRRERMEYLKKETHRILSQNSIHIISPKKPLQFIWDFRWELDMQKVE